MAAGAEIVFTNKSLVPAKVIEALPELRYIGVLATGYNVVDTNAAAARNIPVTNIPDYGTDSVAQMTFALLLELASQPALHNASVRDGDWSACPDFCYWKNRSWNCTGSRWGWWATVRLDKRWLDLAEPLA